MNTLTQPLYGPENSSGDKRAINRLVQVSLLRLLRAYESQYSQMSEAVLTTWFKTLNENSSLVS